MIRAIIFVLIFKHNVCENINTFFEKINHDVIKFNSVAAEIVWNKTGTEERGDAREAEFQFKIITWHQNICKKIAKLHNNHLLNRTQERQAYLLCRGPKYTYYNARNYAHTYYKIRKMYDNAKICIPNEEKISHNISYVGASILDYLSSIQRFINLENDQMTIAVKLAANVEQDSNCLWGDREINKMMKSRNENILKWVWLSWRENIRSMGESFAKLVEIENDAATNNGYSNIGEYWRDEVEVRNLRQITNGLYEEIRPLYELLHGVVRHYLRQAYGNVVPEKGLIPAHLLGSLWSNNWESLADLIIPRALEIDFNTRIKNLNWTVQYMVERTEDFYVSLGLPPMSDAFWRQSVFTRYNESMRCSGSAADMYKDDDVRISYCSETDFHDFYVLHHEMGHIQYFMAYKNQPGIFRQANTALHESIGDAVMYGVMTPQHLHRLRLINDTELYNTGQENYKSDYTDELSTIMRLMKDTPGFQYGGENKEFQKQSLEKNGNQEKQEDKEFENNNFNIDEIIMLKQILDKLPQIPYSLLIEEYRWRYFEGSLKRESLNKEYWTMVKEFMGLAPPTRRSEEYFDLGAELHVADNTPYIRYFLSSFLQHQIFENLCEASVFGHKDPQNMLPASILLSRCDIYGSKVAGKILKDLMSRGSSQHWQVILNETMGEENISASALMRYYRPLQELLLRLAKKYQIPIGW